MFQVVGRRLQAQADDVVPGGHAEGLPEHPVEVHLADVAQGGDDAVLSKEFGDLVAGVAGCPTTLRESLECHLMGIAAEESRHQNGALIQGHK